MSSWQGFAKTTTGKQKCQSTIINFRSVRSGITQHRHMIWIKQMTALLSNQGGDTAQVQAMFIFMLASSWVTQFSLNSKTAALAPSLGSENTAENSHSPEEALEAFPTVLVETSPTWDLLDCFILHGFETNKGLCLHFEKGLAVRSHRPKLWSFSLLMQDRLLLLTEGTIKISVPWYLQSRQHWLLAWASGHYYDLKS